MSDIKNLAIHIFYNEQHKNGYTTAIGKRESMLIAQELMHRTGVPVSIYGGDKHWKTGKYAYWVIELNEPFRQQEQGGFCVAGDSPC